MEHRIIFALFILLAAVPCTTGCSAIKEQVEEFFAPSIDGTSADAFVDSIMKVRGELNEEDKSKFDKALVYAFGVYAKDNPASVIAAGLSTAFMGVNVNDNTFLKNVGTEFMMKLNGKKARELIRAYEDSELAKWF